MSGSLFTPKVYPTADSLETESVVRAVKPDSLGGFFQTITQYSVVALILLLPIIFIPGLPGTIGFDKVLLTLGVSLLVVVLVGLSALRYKSVATIVPLPLLAFWLFSIVGVVSALLSGDVQDSLRGSFIEPQTAGFFVVMALLMTIALVIQNSKRTSLRVLLAFGAASFLAVGYTFIRLFLDPGILSFGNFSSITNSPIGGFNDLAIFSALVVMLCLITMLHFHLRRREQSILVILLVLSLSLLTVVNFFHLWLVVGFFSLLLLVYILSKDTLFSNTSIEDSKPVSKVLVLATVLVCVVSVVFVVAGDYAGSKVSELTNVTYVEVRPSMEATIDIGRAVYGENILLGIGPNRFTDAWRLYKDKDINETLFWSTDFPAGFGFVPTLFITTGLLGGILILAFHVLYLRAGYKMLLKGENNDPFWNYFGVVTFVSSVFLWGMSYVYIPGATILLLTALFTGLSFVAYAALVPKAKIEVPLVNSRKRGFVIMAVVIITLVSAVAVLFTVIKQYSAQVTFLKANAEATTPEEFQVAIIQALQKYRDDTIVGALAQIKLLSMRQMLSIVEPTTDDQERFEALTIDAIALSNEAIAIDPTSPTPYATLADVLSVLSGTGFEGARERALENLTLAQARDPYNPAYSLFGATLAIQAKDLSKARSEIAKALELKPNYSQALFLLTQIDIQEGNIESALANTRQIISFEPNNPTRYYQLGVLLAANNDRGNAITAYETAIALDQNFANARYMLSLAYLAESRLDDALTQLKIVRETNQDNEQLNQLIKQLETGGLASLNGNNLEGAVDEVSPEEDGESAVVTPVNPNTDLVTPVNTVGSSETINPPVADQSE